MLFYSSLFSYEPLSHFTLTLTHSLTVCFTQQPPFCSAVFIHITMPATTPLSFSRPVLLLLVPTLILLLSPLLLNLLRQPSDTPLSFHPLAHLTHPSSSFLSLPLLRNAPPAPAPAPGPVLGTIPGSDSDPDPAAALFRAASSGDQLSQCMLLGDLLYSAEQQGNFSATLLALPRDSPAEAAALASASANAVRCLVTVTGPSFPPGLDDDDDDDDSGGNGGGQGGLPSDIDVKEDTVGTDLVTGHGVPISEDDVPQICFGGCDIRVYQIVRVVDETGGSSTTTLTSTRNNANKGRRRRGNKLSFRRKNNNNNNNGKRRRRRKNQNQKQKQKQNPSLTKPKPPSPPGTGGTTKSQSPSDTKTETLTFIVVQPRFGSPCPLRPKLSPLRSGDDDAEYCFDTTDANVEHTTPFTLVRRSPFPTPSATPATKTRTGTLTGGTTRQVDSRVPMPVPVPLGSGTDVGDDELCKRYNWVLWKSTGQYDYAVGYRIRVIRDFPPLDSGNGVPFPQPVPVPLPGAPSPPLHCSTNGVDARAYDARHCTFGCDATTYNLTALFHRPGEPATLVQFSYADTCSGNMAGIRRCAAPSAFGATPNKNRYPVAASFTVTDPQNDRAKAVRTALERLRQQSSFGDATIGGSLVVETVRINDRTYRVIFRFREQFGSEI